MRKDRLIVGALCLAYAVWIFVSGETGGTIAPAIAFIVLGIWAVATSRREYSTQKIGLTYANYVRLEQKAINNKK